MRPTGKIDRERAVTTRLRRHGQGRALYSKPLKRRDHAVSKRAFRIRKNLVVAGKVALLVIYVERRSRHGWDDLHFDLVPGRFLRAMTGRIP